MLQLCIIDMCVVHVRATSMWCMYVLHVCAACVWALCVVNCLVHVCAACMYCMCCCSLILIYISLAYSLSCGSSPFTRTSHTSNMESLKENREATLPVPPPLYPEIGPGPQVTDLPLLSLPSPSLLRGGSQGGFRV